MNAANLNLQTGVLPLTDTLASTGSQERNLQPAPHLQLLNRQRSWQIPQLNSAALFLVKKHAWWPVNGWKAGLVVANLFKADIGSPLTVIYRLWRGAPCKCKGRRVQVPPAYLIPIIVDIWHNFKVSMYYFTNKLIQSLIFLFAGHLVSYHTQQPRERKVETFHS
jgi:hypothetical protein